MIRVSRTNNLTRRSGIHDIIATGREAKLQTVYVQIKIGAKTLRARHQRKVRQGNTMKDKEGIVLRRPWLNLNKYWCKKLKRNIKFKKCEKLFHICCKTSFSKMGGKCIQQKSTNKWKCEINFVIIHLIKNKQIREKVFRNPKCNF